MLISLTGPSGIGKGFIKERAIRCFPGLQEAIWLTTRPLRDDEKTARSNRHQIELAEFQRLQARDEIIFVQELFGHHYGIRKNGPWFCDSGRWIIEFHIENLLLARRVGISVFSIGLVPGTIDLIASRLDKRESENADEIALRLSAAQYETRLVLANESAFDEIFVISKKNELVVADTIISLIGRFFGEE